MPNSDGKLSRVTYFSGRLTLDSGDHKITVLTEQSDIRVVIPSAAISFRQLFSALKFHRATIDTLHYVFATQGIGLVVEVGGIGVAMLGKDAHAGIFSKLLRIAPIQIRLMPILRAILSGKSLKSEGD